MKIDIYTIDNDNPGKLKFYTTLNENIYYYPYACPGDGYGKLYNNLLGTLSSPDAYADQGVGLVIDDKDWLMNCHVYKIDTDGYGEFRFYDLRPKADIDGYL